MRNTRDTKQLSNEQKGSTKSERKVFHWFDLQDKPTKSHAGVIHRGERSNFREVGARTNLPEVAPLSPVNNPCMGFRRFIL